MNTISKSIGAMATDVLQAQADRVRLEKMAPKNQVERDREDIRKVAEDFESLFLNIVLKSMRETVQKSGLLDGGNAEDIYRSMLDDEYAKMMAAQRHTGIADNIEEFLLRSSGDTSKAETAIEKAVGMKTYQQAGLQNAVKQARIEESGIPSAPFIPQVSSLPKPL